jgi:hypothetical protein
MKDKLEKTGHKKGYYRLKSLLSIFVCSIAITAAAAIPVGISYKLDAATEHNDEKTSVVTEESTSSSQDSDYVVSTGGDAQLADL